MKISREKAIEILKVHGWEPEDLTAYDKNHYRVPGTSFDDEMGIHSEYVLKEVKNWLGY